LLPAGARSELFTQHLDVAPTILGILGIQSPADWLGRNLAAANVPLRGLPVIQEQSHVSGIVDNGLIYRFDEKSGRASLLRIGEHEFVPIDHNSPQASLAAAYGERLSLFRRWVRWRHFQRVVQGN
jgi:arylsulfatase A-like enzyme